jgi:hypothetical protein
MGGQGNGLGLKLKLYSELHYLPSGDASVDGSYIDTMPLPDDRGWLLGAQLGLWNYGRNAHTNLWVRYGNGLAAFDELAQPYGLNRNRRANGAEELRVALSGNLEWAQFGFMYASSYRFFRDADANEADFDDRHEWVSAIRALWFAGLFTPGIEASTQIMRSNGLNPRTDRQELAQVTQVALIPAISLGQSTGSYSRPQLQFIGALTFLNRGARELFPAEDIRSKTEEAFYVGLRAEWWFGRGGGY